MQVRLARRIDKLTALCLLDTRNCVLIRLLWVFVDDHDFRLLASS